MSISIWYCLFSWLVSLISLFLELYYELFSAFLYSERPEHLPQLLKEVLCHSCYYLGVYCIVCLPQLLKKSIMSFLLRLILHLLLVAFFFDK
jgi:hypothetical protein